MKKTSILLFGIIAIVAASCLGSLIPGNSTLSFTLDGTTYADDKASIARVFGATTVVGDTTTAQVSVPDEASGKTMNLTLIFGGNDGTFDVTSGVTGLNLAPNRMSMEIFEGGLGADSSNNFDAVDVTLMVSNWTEDEDGKVTFDATFSGTMLHEETGENVSVSSGVLEIAKVRE